MNPTILTSLLNFNLPQVPLPSLSLDRRITTVTRLREQPALANVALDNCIELTPIAMFVIPFAFLGFLLCLPFVGNVVAQYKDLTTTPIFGGSA